MLSPDNGFGVELLGARVAIFDFETTGVDPTSDRAVQVAVVHSTLAPKGERVDATVALRTKINPGVPIPSGASSVHGIFDEDVVDAPTIDEVLPDLLLALDGRIGVAYNLPFDWQMLRAACDRHGFVPPRFCGLDPLVWAKDVDKYKKGKTLSAVCERRGIRFEAHDATADCMAVAELLSPLLGEWGRHLYSRWGRDKFRQRRPVSTLRTLWHAQCDVARDLERDVADYRARTGGDAPDMPWHALTSTPAEVSHDELSDG
jgi:DNA polymerase-3 subunit epsilon